MRLFIAACLLCALAEACNSQEKKDDSQKIAVEQAKRIDELRKAIAEKKIETMKLESDLARLKAGLPKLKMIEYALGKEVLKVGKFSFSFSHASVSKRNSSDFDRNPKISLTVIVKNETDKDNLVANWLGEKINRAELTDDKGRSYYRGVSSPQPSPPGATNVDVVMVPGQQKTLFFSCPGTPTAGATELYLVLPQIDNEPPIRVTIPVKDIKWDKE